MEQATCFNRRSHEITFKAILSKQVSVKSYQIFKKTKKLQLTLEIEARLKHSK